MRSRIIFLCLICSLFGCSKKKEKFFLQETTPQEQVQVSSTTALKEEDSLNFSEMLEKYSVGLSSPQPWVGYWWPYTASGIATRGYGEWSPAEKYDAAYVEDLKSAGFDAKSYKPMAEWERGWHGPGASPRIESWWGHCNGWAASSLMVFEPRLPKLINGIRFEVEDQKALLAESWLVFSGDFVGTRVDNPGDFSSAAFWDIVPAQFHLILTNIVGKQSKGVILDRHTGAEIWNQPLVGYKIDPIQPADYLGALPEAPSVFRVNVTARIWWANDNVQAYEVTPKFNMTALLNSADPYNDYYFPGRVLQYELWLDGPIIFNQSGQMIKSGNILVVRKNGQYMGGVWKNSDALGLVNTHPDFMWVPFGVQHATYNDDIVLWDKNPRIDDHWVSEKIAGSH